MGEAEEAFPESATVLRKLQVGMCALIGVRMCMYVHMCSSM